MKRIIASIAALMCCFIALDAQESEKMIADIKASPARSKTIDANFKEVRSAMDNSRPSVTLLGKLSYDPSGKITMTYDNGDLFSIDGNIMVISNGGKRQQFDTSKNIMMKSLSHAILYAFSGQMDELAKEQHAKMLTNSKNGKFVVTLAAQAKAARGYSCIEVTYDSVTGILETMRMDEFTGQSTFYSYVK